ncbi:MAG: SDR family NAD(P)-dependent oxidoreductase [Gammaproteobacteria bacterium]|nr:SDR family NAD(P)-dependent oxidoreductase [Gammaproteobacteria bacterium]
MSPRSALEHTAMDLRGKSAVVTGGGNGIGAALCLAFAERGVNVVVADIEADAAVAVAAEAAELGVGSLGLGVDVTDESSVRTLADSSWREFGNVDILVNNAGVMNAISPLHECSAADFDWVFAVNVRGAMNGIRAFVPRFLASKGPGRVANTASEHALGVPHVGAGVYTASKHALLGLSDVLRRELPARVKVSVLCPGIVDSSLWRAGARRQAEFGGPSDAPATGGAFMSRTGMPAAEVAAAAVEGIRTGRFYIVTHPHAVGIARRRWTEVDRAFAQQAPRCEGDEKYDLEPILGSLASGSGTT